MKPLNLGGMGGSGAQDDGMDDETKQQIQQELLKELMEFASNGMAKDTADRYGKSMPMADDEDDMDASGDDSPSVPVPGAEPDEEDSQSGENSAGPDMDKLKAVLLKMKGG